MWDARSGYFIERYEGHLDSVYSVAFSPDGNIHTHLQRENITLLSKQANHWLQAPSTKLSSFGI